MDDLDTLNASISYEITDMPFFNLATAPSDKQSQVYNSKSHFLTTQKDKLINILSANLNLHPDFIQRTEFPYQQQQKSLDPFLRQKYKQLKTKYLDTQKQKAELNSKLHQFLEAPCQECSQIAKKTEDTKKALEEAVSFTSFLLKELHRLDSSE